MSLDIYLEPRNTLPLVGTHGISSFAGGEDADYWFLYPLFEKLYAETGQRIDLYGDAWFGGDDLDALDRTIAEARDLVDKQPDQWDVVVGYRGHMGGDPVTDRGDKIQLLALLETISNAIPEARTSGQFILFFGD